MGRAVPQLYLEIVFHGFNFFFFLHFHLLYSSLHSMSYISACVAYQVETLLHLASSSFLDRSLPTPCTSLKCLPMPSAPCFTSDLWPQCLATMACLVWPIFWIWQAVKVTSQTTEVDLQLVPPDVVLYDGHCTLDLGCPILQHNF